LAFGAGRQCGHAIFFSRNGELHFTPWPVAAEMVAQIAVAGSHAVAFVGEFTKFLQLFKGAPG
jgi:hypothetical protein